MPANKNLIYAVKQIREMEHLAQQQYGVSSHTLMQRAGQAVLELLLQRWPGIQKIAVVCGGGNNGGDGYVLAYLAQQHGLTVTLWQVGQQAHTTTEAHNAFVLCKKNKIIIQPLSDNSELKTADIIVDAVCGIG